MRQVLPVVPAKHNPHYLNNIGYYTVLCTIWKDIVRVGIVLKTRIGRKMIIE
jgi:hypothetical protein